MSAHAPSPHQRERQRWMGILARSSEAELTSLWENYDEKTEYSFLREPEIGLVMVRGRAGGTGGRFNLGEMTVSRCSITLKDGTIGHGYVKGRNRRHAEMIAVFDAHFQKTGTAQFLNKLEAAQKAKADQKSAKAAATKVDFYTMVRGED